MTSLQLPVIDRRTVSYVGAVSPSQLGPASLRPTLRALLAESDSFVEKVMRGEFVRLLWVKFKVVDGCNIRCVMCNHWRRKEYLRNQLSTERLLALADELSNLGAERVRWSGGEPTLRRDLPRIIARYSSCGMRSAITTNGTLINDSYAGELLDAGIDSVLFSLESADPVVHDRVVGHAGAWRKLVSAALALGADPARRPRLGFQTVLTRLNLDNSVPKLVRLALELGVSELRLQPVVVAHLGDDSLVPTTTQVDQLRQVWLPQMRDLAAGRKIKITVDGYSAFAESGDTVSAISPSELDIAPRDFYATRGCFLPFYHCTIDHDGRVFPCCHWRTKESSLGSIVNSSLIDILRSESARRLRRTLNGKEPLSGACLTCTMQLAENAAIEQQLGSAYAQN